MGRGKKPERDPRTGQFLPGNKASAGVSKGKGVKAQRAKQRKNRIIAQMEERVTCGDIDAIVDRAIVDAKGGDRYARDFVFDYLVGRPVKRVMQMEEGDSELGRLMQKLADIMEDDEHNEDPQG